MLLLRVCQATGISITSGLAERKVSGTRFLGMGRDLSYLDSFFLYAGSPGANFGSDEPELWVTAYFGCVVPCSKLREWQRSTVSCKWLGRDLC